MNLIKTRLIPDSENEIEFDFIHPKTNKRIRRKISISQVNAERLCKLLECIIKENLTINETEQLIANDSIFAEYSNAPQLLSLCKILYFNYDSVPIKEEINNAQNTIDDLFSTNNKLKLCFLGRAGVGKSSIIRKMSYFSDTEINFPFVDTSRTTTFSAEYHFSKEKGSYQFAVKFIGQPLLRQQIWDCTERAISKAISKSNELSENSCNDDIISAFYDDPANFFDIRLLLGKHIRVNSKNRFLEKNKKTVENWDSVCQKCKEIAILVKQSPKETTDNCDTDDFYFEKFSSLIKSSDDNETKSAFEAIIDAIHKIVNDNKSSIISDIKNNSSVSEISETESHLICNVTKLTSDKFKAFISVFTSRNIENYGNSLLPLVEKLWIELPYNEKFSDDIQSQKICCFDTIGIAHNDDKSGSFEGSTKLTFDDVDALIVVDDSKVNMDNNTGVILRHISSRISFKKIYFALTFYDAFTKEDFDPEEDLDEQKQQYLSKIQIEKTLEYLENSEYAKKLNRRIGESTYYLSGLSNKSENTVGYKELSKMLNQIRIDAEISHNSLKVAKQRPLSAFVSYDYSKLPLIYLKAQERFMRSQYEIYLSGNHPHFKTTEALTRRLREKISFFTGSKTLKPVDDMFSAFTKELSDYIDSPQEINLIGDTDEVKKDCIEKFKTYLTDNLSKLITSEFFQTETLKIWDKLYLDYGIGVDSRRRNGIINAETGITPNGDIILKSPNSQLLFFKLQELFERSISEFDERLFS